MTFASNATFELSGQTAQDLTITVSTAGTTNPKITFNTEQLTSLFELTFPAGCNRSANTVDCALDADSAQVATIVVKAALARDAIRGQGYFMAKISADNGPADPSPLTSSEEWTSASETAGNWWSARRLITIVGACLAAVARRRTPRPVARSR